MSVLECVGEHYKVQEVPRARVYRWCPATVSLECECGVRPTLTSPTLVLSLDPASLGNPTGKDRYKEAERASTIREADS